MPFSIGDYFLYILNTSQWKQIKKDIESETPIVKIPISYFNKHFKIINRSHLYDLVKLTKKRIVFDTEESELSSKSHNNFLKITGKITLIHYIEPYPRTIYLKCKECNSKWTENISIPILNPDPNDFPCKNPYCSRYLSRNSNTECEITYIDAMKFDFVTGERIVHGFVLDIPSSGFKNVVEKIRKAYEFNSYVTFYGFCTIERIDKKNEYFLEIQDIEILDYKAKRKFIPFLSYENPTSEKEMVMGSFFTNLEYMRHYLGFETYDLQRSYPDLIVHTKHGKMIIEFEYDVANFYLHKHHEQDPPCDLIIAWKCTTKKSTIPYLLLPSLQGTFVIENREWKDPSDVFQKLVNVITVRFPEIETEYIPLLVFPIIDTNIPIMTIKYNKIKITYPGFINFEKIDFFIDKNLYHITLSYKPEEKSITIPIIKKKEKENDIDISLIDDILEVKEYLQFIKRTISPPVQYGKNVVSYLYSMRKDIYYTDFLLIVMSLMAHFFQLNTIDMDFVHYVFKIFPSLKPF